MLNNLTNFFNLITGRRIKTTLEDSDLIAIGTKQSPALGDYKPTAIKFSDLAAQIGAGGFSEVTVNGILANNLQIGPSSLVTVSGSSPNATITLKPEIPYKAYRAKLTAGEIDWPGYGYLYNWFAVDDARGLANPDGGTGLVAPNEWRVPSDTDWTTLITFAGGSSVAGGKLKSTLTSIAYPFYGWLNNGGGTDDYNFGGLGGGKRFDSGSFSNIAVEGVYWTSLSSSTLSAVYYAFSSFNGISYTASANKKQGSSVRLVREATAGELLLTDGDTSDTSSLDPYTGNNGTVYVTVKIGTQIWLAQNLRETLYNNADPIFNASLLPGGDPLGTTWNAKGIVGEGAWTLYGLCGPFGSPIGCPVPYLPDTIELIYADVLENSLGLLVNWSSELDGTNVYYKAIFAGARTWFKTHIKLTPGYDVSDYDNSIPTLVQKNLIVKRAVTGEFNIEFFPVTIDSNGTLTIEPLNNYSDLLGSPDSSVYVEILEYQPESYYYSSSLSQGIGISNL
jgi:uncharacterized protein (TIGR02145 family)